MSVELYASVKELMTTEILEILKKFT